MVRNKRKGSARTSPLPSYVAVVFAATAMISLVSFYLFWNSPARELAEDIQAAKEEQPADPFLPGYEPLEADAADGVLQRTEVHRLLEQAANLADGLEPGRDFALEDFPGASEPR